MANPRGFCAGVDRAIETVNNAIKKFSPQKKIYVWHEIVHNRYVVENFIKQGVTFVEDLDLVPQNDCVLILSAHGVSDAVESGANEKDIIVFDATCPLVKKVHNTAIRNEKSGMKIIVVGHKNHVEVKGTVGRINTPIIVETVEDAKKLDLPKDSALAYVTQTTLSIDDTREIIKILKQRFPQIKGPDSSKDICYATQNRQNAVRKVASMVDMMIIVGSKNSSNSNRLADLANSIGTPSYLIDFKEEVHDEWFENVSKIGISSGASAPEFLVQDLVQYITNKFEITKISDVEITKETAIFKLPAELQES